MKSLLVIFRYITSESLGSLLNWTIINTSIEWGIWTFTPANGTNLTEGDSETIEVKVVAPLEKKKYFTGTVKIINSDDPTDFCEIDAYLITQRPRALTGLNLIIHHIYEKYPNLFPILRHIQA